MIDKWFLEDIKRQIDKRNKVVLIGKGTECEFLLPLLESQNYVILRTDNSLPEHWEKVREELFIRYEAETEHKNRQIVFYTNRNKEKLSFLLDYCFTHGCLDLSDFKGWLTKKIFTYTNLQVKLDSAKLLTASKLSISKDISWWKKIIQNLEDMLDLQDELLPFIHDPEKYMAHLDSDVKRMLEEKILEMLGQPYTHKPPKTLANEVVNRLFEGLLSNDIPVPLLNLYYKWADSSTYRTSLDTYISAYKIDKETNPWKSHVDHCFDSLDIKALKQITANITDKPLVAERLEKIKLRISSPKAHLFAPEWWVDIIYVLKAETNQLSSCKSLSNFIEYYTKHFSKVDRAIRKLYELFLNEDAIIRPLQEHYDSLNSIVLQTWFTLKDKYVSDQQGYLVNLFKQATKKTAVIVGDGIRYEIADYVAHILMKSCKVSKGIMLAGMPSETENNMSAIYAENNQIISLQSDRQKALLQLSRKPIRFIELDKLYQGIDADYLVLPYGDIDSAAEKLQQKALKLFDELENVLIDKISLLLNMGYHQVHLITDHGFVLTGLLDEADKISPYLTGKAEVKERYIRTVEKQKSPDLIEFSAPYGEYKYLYVAKSYRPFKTTGAYGYSHGGFTPQEVIIPKFIFSRQTSSTPTLNVTIENKKELSEVTGELFVIKLLASNNSESVFANQRKVQIKLFKDNFNCQNSNIINITADKDERVEFSFSGNDQLQIVLLDAQTQEQLDTAIIKKSTLRDLGGL